MSLFGINSKRKDYRLMGAHLSLWVHSYMTLYALAKGTSKSKLIITLIEDWVVKEKEKASSEDLINELVKRLTIKWKGLKTSKYNITFVEYTTDIQVELIKKGISEKDVNRIIEKLEYNETNKKARYS